jgi:hypothetical protein
VIEGQAGGDVGRERDALKVGRQERAKEDVEEPDVDQ